MRIVSRYLNKLILLRRATFATILTLSALCASGPAGAQTFRFAERVDFTAKSGLAQMMNAKGTLSTRTAGKLITMRLTNVSIGGATDTVELITHVDAASLTLERSQAYDMVKDQVIREMRRKIDKSQLDGQDTDVFEFTEYTNKAVTRTEPYIEYRVVDFLSMMLVAADAINRGDLTPKDLSVFRDRSVRKATMVFSAEGADRTVVKVAPPDNPTGGVTYVIAKTGDGRYYPAAIRVQSDQGFVELTGTTQ